jgi:hypothetical protein
MVAAPIYPMRKARSVTDTSGHFQFLGWQPTLGELLINIIWPVVVALLALLVEPLRRWLSRTRNSLSDRIASLSDNRRAKRIQTLKLKVQRLKEFDDRKTMAHLLSGIIHLILLIGITIIVSIFAAKDEILMTTLQIGDFLKLPDSSFLVTVQAPPSTSFLATVELLYLAYHSILLALAIFGLFFVAAALQEMDDFSDPPKAIRRLEERINALQLKRILS